MGDFSFYRPGRRGHRGYKLLRPMGFEFTFEKRYEPYTGDHVDALIKLGRLGIKAHEDDGCLEVNSPVFQYSEDPVFYWERIRKILGWRYVSRDPDSTGGGCHIHVGVENVAGKTYQSNSNPEEKPWYKFAIALMNVTRNRPWLAWGMQDPTYEVNQEEYATAIFRDPPNSAFYSGMQNTYNDQLHIYGTVELRFFDTADTAEDLRAYIKTAQTLCRLALAKTPEPARPKMSYAEAAAYLRSGGALKAFRRFLAEHKIEHGDFKLRQFAAWFCDRYYITRSARLAA